MLILNKNWKKNSTFKSTGSHYRPINWRYNLQYFALYSNYSQVVPFSYSDKMLKICASVITTIILLYTILVTSLVLYS